MNYKNTDNYKDFSKKRLLNNIRKKFDTTIIGSLAEFEKSFGYLWGCEFNEDGNPYLIAYNELDVDQKKWRDIWNETRTNILDNGGSNSRAAQNEISQYNFTWNRYVTNFRIKGQGK